jgi:hypothetical protein
MFPFLLIIVAIIVSCIHFSDVNGKISVSGSEDIFDTSQTETEFQESLKSLETSTNVDTETNETSGINTSEDTSNIMSNITNGESITMTPSDLSPGIQSSNLTEVEPESTFTIQEKLSKGIIPNVEIITLPTYKVTVVFDSITVHEDHEGAVSGDAEYDLTAYVQGLKVGLTDKSLSTICVGCDPSPGLYDVSQGETIEFTPDARVTVEIPNTMPLSIFTVGDEVDHSCRSKHLDNIQDKLNAILQKPQDTWFDSVKVVQHNENINSCTSGFNKAALKNPNDILGTITKFYFPPGSSYEPIGYGAGAHTNVVSDTGDFTLRYTIAVTPPSTPEKQTDSNKFSNKFESNNTFTFNKLN